MIISKNETFILQWNMVLSWCLNLYFRGYRGTVRRVLGNSNPVWFEATEPTDCDNVPDQVNAGKPPRDICANVNIYIHKPLSQQH